MGDVWSRRTLVATADSADTDTLSRQLDMPHVVIIAFRTDSVNANQMLYELARYNFTNFLVRNFEIEVEGDEGISRLTVSGFLTYDEAAQYRKQLAASFDALRRHSTLMRLYVVSEANRQLIGTKFSYADYEAFYDKELAPVKTSEEQLLNEPAEIEVRADDEGEETDDGNEETGEEEEEEVLFDFEEDFYR